MKDLFLAKTLLVALVASAPAVWVLRDGHSPEAGVEADVAPPPYHATSGFPCAAGTGYIWASRLLGMERPGPLFMGSGDAFVFEPPRSSLGFRIGGIKFGRRAWAACENGHWEH